VEALWKIPVEECDHRLNAVGQQFIDQIDIVSQTLVVNRVVAATERNDTRPGYTEAVCLGSKRLQESYVFLVDMVRVASDIAARAVRDLARDSAESIPDGITTTVLLSSTLDLVAVLLSVQPSITSIVSFRLTLQ
jgi:hypothetical protein